MTKALCSFSELDNLQRMLDPCSPLDFLWDTLRRDWIKSCFHLGCDPAF